MLQCKLFKIHICVMPEFSMFYKWFDCVHEWCIQNFNVFLLLFNKLYRYFCLQTVVSLFAEVSRYHICLLRFNFISFYCERISDGNQNWRNMIKWFKESDTYGFRSRCNWFCCFFNREFLGLYGGNNLLLSFCHVIVLVYFYSTLSPLSLCWVNRFFFAGYSL